MTGERPALGIGHVLGEGHDETTCPACIERTALNLTTGDLDVLRRLTDAQRELHEAAAALFNAKTSKRADRSQLGRRLNAIAASLRTVELRLMDGADEGL